MHFQDSLLYKWKQGEKRNCPYHGTCDNQRNYRTVQLQAERDQGDMGCQGQQSLEGDLEFRVLTATADSVVMLGKKRGTKIVMTPNFRIAGSI